MINIISNRKMVQTLSLFGLTKISKKKISRWKNRAGIVELKRLKNRWIKMLKDLGKNYIERQWTH